MKFTAINQSKKIVCRAMGTVVIPEADV